MKVNTSARLMVALAASALLAAGAAHAQAESASKVKFPADLRWQAMALVTFDYKPKVLGTPAERQLAKSVWNDTITAMPVNPLYKDGSKYPSFILLSAFDSGPYRYVFSSLDAAHPAYPACEDPPNSADPSTPIYSICPMRVVVENKASGQRTQQDFPGYCNLAVIDQNLPLDKNHTAIAFDERSKTAYFRVIQYGKQVPACDRAIRLK